MHVQRREETETKTKRVREPKMHDRQTDLKEQERAEGVLAGTEVAQSLYTAADGEAHIDLERAIGAEDVVKLEAVVPADS